MNSSTMLPKSSFIQSSLRTQNQSITNSSTKFTCGGVHGSPNPTNASLCPNSSSSTPSFSRPHPLNWSHDSMTNTHGSKVPQATSCPKWNPFQSLLARILDDLESSIIARMDSARLPLSPSVDPKVQLAGNFSPVPECPVTHGLPVEGTLPSCLMGGVYVRNGANPRFEPKGGHHVFDGDGMLHAVSFDCVDNRNMASLDGVGNMNMASFDFGDNKTGLNDGDKHRASYASRFTRTYRLSVEEELGRPLFPKPVGDLHGASGIAKLLVFYARALAGVVKLSRGVGVANAGLTFFDGSLLAMSEDDLPYRVRICGNGDLETVGRYDFHGQLSPSATMVAHPKLDPITGELFSIGYSVVSKPYLKYFKFSPTGFKAAEVPISLPHPTLIHDFAITQQFVIIPDQQLIFHIPSMLKGTSPVVFDKNKTSRFGILARDAVDETALEWIDVPDCFCFHLWNAWEEKDGGEIVIIGSCMTPADGVFNGCNGNDDQHSGSSPFRSILSEVRLDRRSRTSQRREITPSLNLEAGHVNRHYLGRKSRYAYLAITEPWPKVSGIAKVDLTRVCDINEGDNETLDTSVVAKFMFKEGCYGGEPMFVPSYGDDALGDEDDGYVLTFLHDEECGKSELLVLNAKSPCLDLVASVKIPCRVPFGFHGTFITCKELQKQH